jgi:hypothetical protein
MAAMHPVLLALEKDVRDIYNTIRDRVDLAKSSGVTELDFVLPNVIGPEASLPRDNEIYVYGRIIEKIREDRMFVQINIDIDKEISVLTIRWKLGLPVNVINKYRNIIKSARKQ